MKGLWERLRWRLGVRPPQPHPWIGREVLYVTPRTQQTARAVIQDVHQHEEATLAELVIPYRRAHLLNVPLGPLPDQPHWRPLGWKP